MINSTSSGRRRRHNANVHSLHTHAVFTRARVILKTTKSLLLLLRLLLLVNLYLSRRIIGNGGNKTLVEGFLYTEKKCDIHGDTFDDLHFQDACVDAFINPQMMAGCKKM